MPGNGGLDRGADDGSARPPGAVELDRLLGRVAAAVAAAETREAVWQAVRDPLQEALSYVWTGRLDLEDRSLAAVAGSDEEPAGVFAGDGGFPPAVARVFEERTVTTVVADGERWAAHAAERDHEAATLVPVTDERAVYGLVVIGHAGPPTLPDASRDRLADIGTVVGNALADRDRRAVLLGGDSIAVTLVVRGAIGPIFGDDVPADVAVHFERTIPLSEGALLQYVTVRGMDAAAFRAAAEDVDELPHVRQVRSGEGETLFETIYTGPSIIDALAGHGARVLASHFEGGDHYTTAVLSREEDLRNVIAEVQAAFPDAEVAAQRQRVKTRTAGEFRTTVIDRLTDRQRTVVEAALAGGYFERPRESTGEQLADALDISPSTFSQHLRAANRKLYATLFEDTPD